MIDEASVIESFERLERRVAAIENSDMLQLQAVDRDVLGALSLRLTRLEDYLSKLEAQATVSVIRSAEWTPEQMAEQEARIKADRERWEKIQGKEESIRIHLLDSISAGFNDKSLEPDLDELLLLVKIYKRMGR